MAIDQASRKELNYEWTAVYNDGSFLHQYDDLSNRENKFADIEQDKLVQFIIERIDKKKSFGVDLKTGLFLSDGLPFEKIEIDGKEHDLGKHIPDGTKVKLIYFRRVLRTLNAATAEEALINIFHFIGWDSVVEGKSEKHTISISNKTDEIIL